MPNQTPPERERQIVERTTQFPTYSYVRIAGQLRLTGVVVESLLTDTDREFCGRELHHSFELYLTISQVRHRRPDLGSPETNGFCERFQRTLKEEFFAGDFGKTFHESVEQLQVDRDRYLEFYNRERTHQGSRTQGRTLYQAFLDGVNKRRKKTPCLRSESPEL